MLIGEALVARALRILKRPFVAPVVDDGGLLFALGACNGRNLLEDAAQLSAFHVNAVVLAAVVRDDGGVELFAGALALAPLEIQHAIAAVRNGLQAGKDVHAGLFALGDGLPVGRTGAVFHQPERLALHGVVKVMHERRVNGRVLNGFGRLMPGRIGVPGGQVDLLRHIEVVDAVVEVHHVRADLALRHDLAEAVALPLHEVDRLMGDEALPVELQTMDAVFAVRRGTLDVGEIRIVMAPELAVPGLVDRLNRAVFFPEPAAERLLAELAVAFAAVFVGKMPHDHAGMTAKAGGQLLVHLLDFLAVDGRGVAVVVALAEKVAHAVRAYAQHLRVFARHPRGARARGCCQIHPDAGGIEIVDDLRHPVEVVLALLGLKGCPGENAQRDDADIRFFHQLNVLREDVRAVKPLIRIVICTVVYFGMRHGESSFLMI